MSNDKSHHLLRIKHCGVLTFALYVSMHWNSSVIVFMILNNPRLNFNMTSVSFENLCNRTDAGAPVEYKIRSKYLRVRPANSNGKWRKPYQHAENGRASLIESSDNG